MTMHRNPDIEAVILDRMAQHTHALVASAWFTNKRIRQKAEAMKARIVVSDKHRKAPSHWHVVSKDEGAMMHYKFMVLGDGTEWKEVIFGSYNFTENANHNDEFVKVSVDRNDIEELVRAFEELHPTSLQPEDDDEDLDLGFWYETCSLYVTRWQPWDFIWGAGDWADADLFGIKGAMARKDECGLAAADPDADDFGHSLLAVIHSVGEKINPRQACWAYFGDDVPHHKALIVKDENNGTTWTVSKRPIKGSDRIKTVRQIYECMDGYYCPFEPPAPIEEIETCVCFDKHISERHFLYKVRFGAHWSCDINGKVRVLPEELGPRTITYSDAL